MKHQTPRRSGKVISQKIKIISIQLAQHNHITLPEAWDFVLEYWRDNYGKELTYELVEEEYLKGIKMQERELKDNVVKLLKQYVRQRKPVRIIFGDLESDCVIIEGLEVGLHSEGRYLLGLDLWIDEPTRKTIFVASPIISIFVEDFEIRYESWFLEYTLRYLEGNDVYKLVINSGEYGVKINERRISEK